MELNGELDERDIKSMQLIQRNHKRNLTTGQNMRPYQWILILIPSLLQMQGIVDQNSIKFCYEASTEFSFGSCILKEVNLDQLRK